MNQPIENMLDFLKSRRSVRKFDTEKEISKDLLQKILEAGVIAPSAKNAQPWHFYLITSEEAKSKIRQCYSRGEWFDEAQAYVLVIANEPDCWVYADGQANSAYTDGAIATTHMMLEAWALGIGSTWVCAFDREKCCELFGLELGIRTPLNILALGYPKVDTKELPFKRKDFTDVVTEL